VVVLEPSRWRPVAKGSEEREGSLWRPLRQSCRGSGMNDGSIEGQPGSVKGFGRTWLQFDGRELNSDTLEPGDKIPSVAIGGEISDGMSGI
jgi:hypothetical protein